MPDIVNNKRTTHVAQQVSGKDDNGKNILSVLVKKSYRIDAKGICYDDVPTEPLIKKLKHYEDTEGRILEHDLDIYPFKICTDIVVKGYAQSNGNQSNFISEIQIGKHKTSLLVIGNRKANLAGNGKVTFSEPKLIDKIPLRYDYAYGGWDKIGEYKIETHSEERIKTIGTAIDWQKGSPYMYPRNPYGKGYLVDLNQEAVEQLELPNLEDPKDRLSSSRLAAGDRTQWAEMPVPRCTDWVNIPWFPRGAYWGLPIHDAKQAVKNIEEVSRGWALNGLLDKKQPEKNFNFRCVNGASLGLQLPFLLGNETCRLVNVHPRKSVFTFKLPGRIPRISVDGRNGILKATVPVLHTVIIEPEKDLVTLVWRGSARALRPYLEHELKEMPFKVEL